MKITKKFMRKSYAFLLAVVMVFGLCMVPAMPTYASTDELGTITKYNDGLYDSYEEAEADLADITAQNVAADKMDNYLSDSGEVVEIPTYSDPTLAADFIRSCMVERRSSVKFVYKIGTYTSKAQAEKLADAAFEKIWDKIFIETANYDEGDYLRWNWGGSSANYTGRTNTDNVTFTISMKYLSTGAQEAQITKKVNSLLNGKFDGWEKRTDANNARRVYNWILDNFDYDDSLKEHSTYGGMIKGSTVCQGYATASYRLLREMGIENRLIASETHGWNIVKIGNKFYGFDTTWGDDFWEIYQVDGAKYWFFLCSEDELKYFDEDGEHTRTSEYNTSSFHKKYPMSSSFYDYSSADNKTVGVPTVGVSYRTHIQSYGWQAYKKDGKTSGTSGEAKRLEAIQIKLTNTSKVDLGIEYKTHIQSYGWENTWKKNGASSGTSGEAKRLEAIKIRLTGADAARYDVYYRVHAQTYGWLGWAKNGEAAGTAGQGKRLEAIQIKIVKKGTIPSGTVGYSYVEYGKTAQENSNVTGLVNYKTHVQSYGWQEYVCDGSLSGTYGEAKRLEAIRINLGNTGISGSIQYRTHVQSYGWMGWKSNGSMSGTSGEGKRLEAIQIKLTGNIAKEYDVFYRVHAQSYGWLGWAKNGQSAGTQGYGKRLEAIQIVLVPKGKGAPSASTQPDFIKK